VLALDIYPQLLVRTLDFLGCSPSTKSINDAIRKWNAVELEEAAAAEGLVLAMVRTNEATASNSTEQRNDAAAISNRFSNSCLPKRGS
jgi:hypothetical protein